MVDENTGVSFFFEKKPEKDALIKDFTQQWERGPWAFLKKFGAKIGFRI
jgi:hypothetical protein